MTDKKSKSITLAPIMQCFYELDQTWGNVDWSPNNELQKEIDSRRKETPIDFKTFFSDKELETKIADNAEELNEFAAANDFDIRLEPFPTDDPMTQHLGVAALLKVLLEWKSKGSNTTFSYEDESYDAVLMEYHRKVYYSEATKKPVAEIEAKNGDMVYMTVMNDVFKQDHELTNKALEITNSLERSWDFKDVIFPKIEYNEQVDLSDLVGMVGSCPGFVSVKVAQAVQQTKFNMDEKEAKVESLAMVHFSGTLSGCGPVGEFKFVPPLEIDEPFLLWIMRPGLDIPIFTAYFNTDTWLLKEPSEDDAKVRTEAYGPMLLTSDLLDVEDNVLTLNSENFTSDSIKLEGDAEIKLVWPEEDEVNEDGV